MKHSDNLVRMANQIGTFFESMPDRAEALENLARHIGNFWAPPMRHELLEHIGTGHEPAVQPIVLEALQVHRQLVDRRTTVATG